MSANTRSHEISGWHFPRNQVAENYLKTLSSGVVLSTTVFAPPQTGLTRFFLHEIVPCAHQQKYITIYIDLSDKKVPITVSVMVALEKTFSELSFFKIGFNFLKGMLHSNSVDKHLVNHEDLTDQLFFQKNNKNFLDLIDRLFQKLLINNQLLILVDHAHNLGKDELSLEFCVYFKNLIAKNSKNIRPLYATNNMDEWALVFKNRKSVLNSEGAFVHKLPMLGKVFVREVLLKMKIKISMEEAVRCFEMTACRPRDFIDGLIEWEKSGTQSVLQIFEKKFAAKKVAASYSSIEHF